jgi:hypothetical protein
MTENILLNSTNIGTIPIPIEGIEALQTFVKALRLGQNIILTYGKGNSLTLLATVEADYSLSAVRYIKDRDKNDGSYTPILSQHFDYQALRELARIENLFYLPGQMTVGRKKEHKPELAPPYLYAEQDDRALEEQWAFWQQFQQDTGLSVMLVYTGGKSLHAYILLNERTTWGNWEYLQSFLCAYALSDIAVTRPHQPMRLPGFPRIKNGVEREVCIYQTSDSYYSPDDVREALEENWRHEYPLSAERWDLFVSITTRENNPLLEVPEGITRESAFNLPIEDLEVALGKKKKVERTVKPAQKRAKSSTGSTGNNPLAQFLDDVLMPALGALPLEQQFLLGGYDHQFRESGSKLIGCSPWSPTNSSGTAFQVLPDGAWYCHSYGKGSQSVKQYLQLLWYGRVGRDLGGHDFVEFCQRLADELGIQFPEFKNWGRDEPEETAIAPYEIADLHQWLVECPDIEDDCPPVEDDPNFNAWCCELIRLEDIAALDAFECFDTNFPNHISIEQRYTSDFDVIQFHHALIKAAKGTGKSFLVADWVEAKFTGSETVFVVTNRVAIVDKLVHDYGYIHYENVRFFKPGQKYVICINSLWKIPEQLRDGAILVIDEAESTLHDMALSRLMTEERNIIRNCVEHLLTQSKAFLGLDADISSGTVNYIQKLIPAQLIINKYKPQAHKGKDGGAVNLEVVKSKIDDVKNDLKKRVEGKTPLIYCDIATTAEYLKTVFPEFDLVTSETKWEYPQIFEDSDNYKPKGLIASPTLATAISFDHEHFDIVIGIFEGAHTDVDRLFQGISRERSGCDRIIYCCLGDSERRLKRVAECMENLLDKYRKDCPLADVVATPFTHFGVYQEAKVTRQTAFPLKAILQKGNDEGYNVFVTEPGGCAIDGEATVRETKKQIRDEKIADIIGAEDLSDWEMEELSEKKQLTQYEQRAFTKACIRKKLRCDEVGEEEVRFYRDERKLAAIHRRELLASPEFAHDRDYKQEHRYARDKEFAQLTVQLLKDLKLDWFIDNTENVTPALMDELAAGARERARDVKTLLGIDTRRLKNDNVLARNLLSCVGIKAASKVVKVGGESVRVMKVAPDPYFESVLARREKAREAPEEGTDLAIIIGKKAKSVTETVYPDTKLGNSAGDDEVLTNERQIGIYFGERAKVNIPESRINALITRLGYCPSWRLMKEELEPYPPGTFDAVMGILARRNAQEHQRIEKLYDAALMEVF